MMNEIPGFTHFSFTNNETTKTVYQKGDGRLPGIVIMHELPGMVPECIALAERVAEQGFTVFLPLLFGQPGEKSPAKFTLQLCISREFYLLAHHKSSPITNWLRALCREVNQRCQGTGVGVIGMCLTGGFVLSLAIDNAVKAPVLSQPGIPIGMGKAAKAALATSPTELEAVQKRVKEEGLPLLGLRFTEDFLCPPERFDTLTTLFGDKFRRIEIDSSPGNSQNIPQRAHSVLTVDYHDVPGHPTYEAFAEVVNFMTAQLKR